MSDVLETCLDAAEDYMLARLNASVRTHTGSDRGANLRLWSSLSTWDSAANPINVWIIRSDSDLQTVTCNAPPSEIATVHFGLAGNRASAVVTTYWMSGPTRLSTKARRLEVIRQGLTWVAGDPPESVKLGDNPFAAVAKRILIHGG